MAYAMDLVGEHDSAKKFHQWAWQTIQRYQLKMQVCIEKINKGKHPSEADYFHCRFKPNGDEIESDWTNHQLDSLGTWLWSFYEHISLTGKNQFQKNEVDALITTRNYLIALWKFPCFDSWEENGDKLHTYTLASISSGLAKLSILLDDRKSRKISVEIADYLKNNAINENFFTKYIGSKDVDSNLIGLATPF